MNSILKRVFTRWLLFPGVFVAILFAPQIWLQIKYKDRIYWQLNDLPAQEFTVIFGAWVHEDHTLSDVTKERVAAGVQLYKSGKTKKLFLSGDNRSNQQADEMANYATANGVPFSDIIVDSLGIDTNDTCKHFAKVGRKAILVTQAYHLPRTMLMCETSQIDVMGLAANKLGILESRGNNLIQIYSIRIFRLFREATLTWLFLFGIYDQLSVEAEQLGQEGE
ncbi:MAG TPA: ElyC/SanA/YdcF family protein [Anaerolineales bacterium]|nr:ElyC/SanA/YdcF family protein [Anaerolineales bacterium]